MNQRIDLVDKSQMAVFVNILFNDFTIKEDFTERAYNWTYLVKKYYSEEISIKKW